MIRFMPEDGDEEEEDEDDPSSDGVGSYLEYFYRRFMEEMRTSPVVTKSHNNNKNNNAIVPRTGTKKSTSWLHCVDVRDLGCQSACRSDSIKEEWKAIVTPNEASELDAADNNNNLPMSRHEKKKKKKKAAFITSDPSGGRRNNNHKKNDATAHNSKNDSHGSVPFVPESRGRNPERIELEKLRSAGKLVTINDDEDESDNDDEDLEEEEELTYPSFEGFFGQNTYVSFFSSRVFLLCCHFNGCVRMENENKLFLLLLFLFAFVLDHTLFFVFSDYLYYSLPVHLYYSLFLAKCVTS
mmetsp:Transcript_55669/g.62997  ORF Transcript_55669/g.62997 Transcript_55669/m.62997 type:complete len:297 (-) Transcript_55669:45-935(-)